MASNGIAVAFALHSQKSCWVRISLDSRKSIKSSPQKTKTFFGEPAILKYFTEAAHPGENCWNIGPFLGLAFVNLQVLISYVSMERKILRLFTIHSS